MVILSVLDLRSGTCQTGRVSLQDVADRTGCPIRFLVGVRAVESGGNPRAVRFEPHIFQRHRSELVVEIARDTSVEEAHPQRIAAWKEGKIPYTPGRMRDGKPRAASSSREETDRTAFEVARKLDAVAAVVSSSWGSYQQLGGSFPKALNVSMTTAVDANAVVARFDADPPGVSDKLLAAWLVANPKALAAAKAGDVEEFVRRYNGGPNPGYCAKMRKAFADFDAGKIKP
jgi:hypothetical protein